MSGVAIVTGAANGIGRAVCLRLAAYITGQTLMVTGGAFMF
ncbi:MAG: hypothetical protein ACREQV_13490 [Candidatus Binatia bacterium]